jgi:hypothetical protein
MTIYVWRDGRWREKRSGEPLRLPVGNAVAAPIVQSDIADYRSPIDGRLITSRSQRREDLRRNGCVEAEPRPTHKRGYRNPRFATKRGLPLREDT